MILAPTYFGKLPLYFAQLVFQGYSFSFHSLLRISKEPRGPGNIGNAHTKESLKDKQAILKKISFQAFDRKRNYKINPIIKLHIEPMSTQS